jgi:hypothetical protein
MEILPLSHRDSESFDWKCPKAHQPSGIFGWVRDDDGNEFALVRGMLTATWLLGDGKSEAVPVPREEQAKIERLMAPQLRAVARAASWPVVDCTDDDDENNTP